jgi:excisionase family DNA binding protein
MGQQHNERMWRDDRQQRPLLLDAQGAAQYLRVSRTTIYTLVEKGQLRGMKIGRSRRFSLRELQAFVDRLERERHLED